ncbi:hypothetical protein DOK_05058 [gamma proteobacterium BDW918]|uniref:Secreted protein n=1 Tax=Zhongshania aliphaticivorans TaxID=1470434 RepID=A0A127M575_9GAMM|nr:hypothetical protein [Zhongshania aliphaticivorans]AMO68341.1 hypothetical protein AZF00_08495 [Zhongshania aliphaticivorans]EIF44237.1 hypothetical protein DOK_05058 [gamma proteobacterium BDW918]
MHKKALSYILLVLIALQSLTTMADVHPINHADTVHFSGDEAHSNASEKGEDSGQETTAPSQLDLTADGLSHCHHHGCLGHFYLSGKLAEPDFLQHNQFHSHYHASIPTAPFSLLYRPPIV